MFRLPPRKFFADSARRRCPRMRVLILLVAASAILPGNDAAGKPAGASDSRSPYSTEDVVSARESGRFTLDFVMKAAADGSGGVIEDWIRAGGSVDDRDAKAPRRGQTTDRPCQLWRCQLAPPGPAPQAVGCSHTSERNRGATRAS